MTTMNHAAAEMTTATAVELDEKAPGILQGQDRAKYIARFKVIANERQLTAGDMLLRNFLLGKDLLNGFTAVTNKNKLNNGHAPWLGAQQAREAISYLNLRTATQSSKRWGISHEAPNAALHGLSKALMDEVSTPLYQALAARIKG